MHPIIIALIFATLLAVFAVAITLKSSQINNLRATLKKEEDAHFKVTKTNSILIKEITILANPTTINIEEYLTIAEKWRSEPACKGNCGDNYCDEYGCVDRKRERIYEVGETSLNQVGISKPTDVIESFNRESTPNT